MQTQTPNMFTMKKIVLLSLVFTLVVISVSAQKEQELGISLKGFVKNDVFFDSRQTVSAREGHFLLWPKPELPDARGDDVNEQPQFNMLALQSRLSGVITGPEVLGARTSGMIEGDFFAQANDNINLFRLRHAFVRLAWENTELLAGQYWNPMFVTSCYPGTVSFNTGVPMQPFARNPQLRLKHTTGAIDVMVAALTQRDYVSRAEGQASSRFLRNSGLPDMHFQLHFNGSLFQAGAGLAYKTILPRLETEQGLKTDAAVSGLSGLAYVKLDLEPVTIKMEAVSGQNLTDMLQISGFATRTLDPASDERSYEPLRNLSLWTDIHTNGNPWQVGLFGGYTRNLGTTKAILDDADLIFGFGNNLASLYRISPRVLYNAGKLRFGLEGEYTAATFGSDIDEHAVPMDTHRESNTRVLFSVYYFF